MPELPPLIEELVAVGMRLPANAGMVLTKSGNVRRRRGLQLFSAHHGERSWRLITVAAHDARAGHGDLGEPRSSRESESLRRGEHRSTRPMR